MPLTLKLHELDNVALARIDLRVGVLLPESNGLKVLDEVPRFHKIAIQDIAQGEKIHKYNQVIGVAAVAIRQGEHVHSHNCAMGNNDVSRVIEEWDVLPKKLSARKKNLFFDGYKRSKGKAGTRNYIGIITSVNCSATVAKQIEHHFTQSDLLSQYPNVDGVVAFTHGTGCGMDQGEGFDILNRVYSGYASHSNFYGVLMVGLGCEVMQLDDFKAREGITEGQRFQSLVIQHAGGTRKSVEAGIKIVELMIAEADAISREPIPVSELAVGLQCGGSDALSGITANPALGAAMDMLVEYGGTAILSETPEIYGAEHLLLRRARTLEVAQALIDRLDWWLGYASKNDAELNNNPSPGNKAGGLTTILEKSLGAQSKGGSSVLNGVYEYGAAIDKSGLVFMDSPGYDPVSVTGQMASGANIICFTTGRGSAYGSKPAPCIKLATNTALYDNMTEDMDVNCGLVFDGDLTVAQCGEKIFQEIIAVASGKRSKSELIGYGNHEFLPWQIGAVM